jgi:hypothetical protein
MRSYPPASSFTKPKAAQKQGDSGRFQFRARMASDDQGWSPRRTSALLAASIIAAGTLLPSASFAMGGQDAFAGLQTVDDRKLSHMRGGFSVAGINVAFGAVVTTMINGVAVLQTQFVATNAGLIANQSGPVTTTSTPLAGLPGTKVTVAQGPSGPNTQVVTVAAPTGTTAAIATIGSQKIVNAIVSNASNQNISQQIELNVQLSNFNSVANQMGHDQLGSQVANSVQAALQASLPH